LGSAPYEIIFVPIAQSQLDAMRTYETRRVLEAIEENLVHEPLVRTRNRKEINLSGLSVGFEFEAPLWELRVGEWRVFYNVKEEVHGVYVRAVLNKPPGKTTQEVVR
jgi:hypothetical protein